MKGGRKYNIWFNLIIGYWFFVQDFRNGLLLKLVLSEAGNSIFELLFDHGGFWKVSKIWILTEFLLFQFPANQSWNKVDNLNKLWKLARKKFEKSLKSSGKAKKAQIKVRKLRKS